MIDDFLFVLLHISIILILLLLIYILRIRKKGQIQIIFLINILLLLVWSLGYVLDSYYRLYTGEPSMLFVYIWNIGLCFIPYSLLLTGLIYANTKIRFGLKHILLFIPPLVSYIMLLTNSYHNLFFVYFSIDNDKIVYGSYFIVHSIFMYGYLSAGIYYLISFSIKNSGFFSRQSILIAIGSAIPVVTNIVIIIRLIKVPLYTTAISFSAAVLFIAVAIFRYHFLSISPIALRTIVDKISDGFMVVNDEYRVIDYNKTMEMAFEKILTISRSKTLQEVFEGTCLIDDDSNLIDFINMANISAMSVIFEKHIQKDQYDKYFSIEVTPIIINKSQLSTVILFRDVTENVRHLEAIEEKHAIMMEQERLASLGHLIGGIAHNLKTPIMSIAGIVEGLQDLVNEYRASMEDESVTVSDHYEIADEMESWLNKIKPYCSYVSDIIDAVKGQAVKLSASSPVSFTINELVKRIQILMKYELIKCKCELKTKISVNLSSELHGDINSLIQVFDNIIINAIQAYEGKPGSIDFHIDGDNEDILFTIRDYAKGIPNNIKQKLLKEMVTTKGTAGTGLGLYMSYSTIKGRFGGEMWFESEEGNGTTFFVKLPRKIRSAG
ncbi:MAG TPA: histidine kinase N-terminal 7TM domain-containing protein [Clostridia bacterium]